MSDVVVRSSFSREETIKRLRHLFRKGNSLGVEMTVLHGEYYLSPAPETYMGPIPGMSRSNSLDPFYMQFRVKEHKETNSSTIYITPQSKATFIALSSMFLSMAWIFIIVISLAEKRWLEKEVYLGGVAFTILMLLYFKYSGGKERKVIERIAKEFE